MYPYKNTAITNKEGMEITDYSIELNFIDEIHTEAEINYKEGDTPKTETLQLNYHSNDHQAFIYGMESSIESKDGNPYGGGRFDIEEPTRIK